MTQLDVIFGRPGDTAVDPVCKMTVDKANPSGGTAEHEGDTYYFCSGGCREAFVANPGQCLTGICADESHHGHDHGTH